MITKNILKESLFCLTVLTILTTGCSKNPGKQIQGKWQNSTKSSTMEFFNNGEFSSKFAFTISSGEKLDWEEVYMTKGSMGAGVTQIELGYKLIRYLPKNKFSILLKREAVTTLPAEGEFKALPEGKEPWAKMGIHTDGAGNIKIQDKHQGQRVEFFKAVDSDPLLFYVYLNGEELPIDGLQLMINSIDLQLNWIGQLTAKGSYRFKNDRDFEAYIPLKTSESNLIFVVFEGTVDKNRISLVATNFGLTVEDYQKYSIYNKLKRLFTSH